MPQSIYIFCRVTCPYPILIFPESDIQNPVQTVLNSPVGPFTFPVFLCLHPFLTVYGIRHCHRCFIFSVMVAMHAPAPFHPFRSGWSSHQWLQLLRSFLQLLLSNEKNIMEPNRIDHLEHPVDFSYEIQYSRFYLYCIDMKLCVYREHKFIKA